MGWKASSTARSTDREQQTFEVTHPFHPLFGQHFELLDHRQTWGEDRVYYYDTQGQLKSLPAAWTSVSAADPFVSIAAGRSYFHIASLSELSRLIGPREA
jgi:hypothetical protein